jgi:hypothetical protein
MGSKVRFHPLTHSRFNSFEISSNRPNHG